MVQEGVGVIKSGSHHESNVFPTTTVEALLSQNEDLMARLTVILRRNSELESRYKSLYENFSKNQESNDSLIDEVTLLREKTKKFESLYLSIKSDRDDLEKRFGAFYSKAQESDAKNKIFSQDLERQIARSKRYEQRIEKYVRPLLDKRLAQIKYLESQILDMNSKRLTSEDMHRALQNSFRDATEQVKRQNKEYADDLSRLTEHHESETQNLRAEIKGLQGELTLWENRDHESKKKFEQLIEKNIQLENKLIFSERKRAEMSTEHQSEIESLNATICELRAHSGQLELIVKDLKPQVEENKKRESLFKKELAEIKLEYENLNHLHKETLIVMQELSDQEKATTTLNQELTKALEKQRRDFSETKLKRIEIDIKKSSQERLEDLSVQSKLVQNKALIDRIDLLFGELQSGFVSPTPNPEIKDQLISERGEIEDIV